MFLKGIQFKALFFEMEKRTIPKLLLGNYPESHASGYGRVLEWYTGKSQKLLPRGVRVRIPPRPPLFVGSKEKPMVGKPQFPSYFGSLVKTSITPPCHGGGHGFESRRSRQPTLMRRCKR